ncbi:hypothetical protein VTJ49DRAFT_2791 [Mycothermus thermophilus]|uniref:Uncharacterized protein n=1 Tax=Humicola insolens TaxID=85995 RepID=A0ABR3V9N4_HUMIN
MYPTSHTELPAPLSAAKTARQLWHRPRSSPSPTGLEFWRRVPTNHPPSCLEFWKSSTLQRRPSQPQDQFANCVDNGSASKMLIPKADRKAIHEYLFREGVMVAEKK